MRRIFGFAVLMFFGLLFTGCEEAFMIDYKVENIASCEVEFTINGSHHKLASGESLKTKEYSSPDLKVVNSASPVTIRTGYSKATIQNYEPYSVVVINTLTEDVDFSIGLMLSKKENYRHTYDIAAATISENGKTNSTTNIELSEYTPETYGNPIATTKTGIHLTLSTYFKDRTLYFTISE